MRMSYEMHKICMKTPYEMLITRLESLMDVDLNLRPPNVNKILGVEMAKLARASVLVVWVAPAWFRTL